MTVISNPGLIQGGSDYRALYLKVFSGEVLTQFREKNVMRNLITLRTIPFGKSAQFPVLGKGYATTHVPGTDMLDTSGVTTYSLPPQSGDALAQLPNQFSHNERIIYVDNKIVAPVMIGDIDEMLNHYDVRSLYAMELANTISNAFDKTAILGLILAARTSSTSGDASGSGELVAGEPGGGYNGRGGCYGIGATPTGAVISDVLFKCAQRFDEIDIPKEGRVCLLPPQAYYAIIKDPSLYLVSGTGSGSTVPAAVRAAVGTASLTLAGAAGYTNPNLQFGNANWGAGTVASVAGITIIPTNHIPTADYATADTNFFKVLQGSNGNKYNFNCSSGRATAGQTQGIVFHSSALGCLMLKDLTTESDYITQRQATLFLAKMLAGFRYLRPSSVIELTSVDKSAVSSYA